MEVCLNREEDFHPKYTEMLGHKLIEIGVNYNRGISTKSEGPDAI